ncbi:MAG: hypothetical protein WCK98_01415 [bacterium]
MPRKKKQKKIEKKANIIKKIKEREGVKKTYNDKFLNTEVELAPNAFEIYEEISATNAIVLREKTDLDLGDEVLEAKPKQKDLQAEYHKKIESVVGVLKSDSHDSTIKEILSKIEDEKKEFDNRVKTNLKDSKTPSVEAVIIEKETLFTKIYAREFAESMQPKSIFRSLLSIFTSDIVWQAIAGALVLAVALFYFQGLQPTLIRSLAIRSKSQVQDLADRYNEQSKDFFTSQNIILGRFSYQPELLCSQIPLYDQTASDTDNVNRLRIGMFADPKYKKLDNSSNFSDNQITSEYTSVYSSYSFKLKTYQQRADDLLEYVRFLEYKNSWIKSCTLVEQNGSNLAAVQDTCNSILNVNDTFAEDKTKLTFWKDIEPSVNNIVASCQSLNKNNLKDFQKTWFVSFDRISQVKPETTITDQDLLNINDQFINNDIKKAQINIDAIIENKTSLSGQWYILNFNL